MRELSKLISDRDDDDDEVWVTHYSSNHQILLVGEGDFSFSCSLATRFGSASNICASSLDSYGDVVRKYKKARSNLEKLKRLGAVLLHGVDATKLKLHPDLSCRRFDRVVFNFPHAGFYGKESDPCLIRKHRELVYGFFHGASHMLRADGQVHVSHKNKAPFCHWNLEELASRCFLALIQGVAFEKSKYPGYENKRGDGSRCDQPFLLGECTTFKFRFSSVAKELYAEKVKLRGVMEQPESKCPQAFSNNQPVSFDHGYPFQREFQGVIQTPVSFDFSYRWDYNLRQVQHPLVQSRQRISPLDLPSYYREHGCSQLEDASPVRATQRPASFALERNHARFQYCDIPFEASHYRQEKFLDCSSHLDGFSLGIYDRRIESMLTRTSFPHPYTGESRERRLLLYQDFPVHQASQEPFFECSDRFNGTYGGEGRRMLTSTRFPHPYAGESQEGSLTRQSDLNIYLPRRF